MRKIEKISEQHLHKGQSFTKTPQMRVILCPIVSLNGPQPRTLDGEADCYAKWEKRAPFSLKWFYWFSEVLGVFTAIDLSTLIGKNVSMGCAIIGHLAQQ